MSVETPNVSHVAPSRLPQLPAIQSLRGIAAVLVVVSHLVIIESRYSPDAILGDWTLLGMAGVDLFFVISGFIMVYVTTSTVRGSGAPIPFLWRRVTRIYPLYWIVSLAVLGVWLLRPDMVNSSSGDPDLVRSFLLYPQREPPLLAVGWTLVHELYFYLFFALSLLLARRWLLPILTLWAAIIFGVTALGIVGGPVQTLVTSPLTLEFIAGCVLGAVFLKDRLSRWVVLALLVLGCVAVAIAIQLYVQSGQAVPSTVLNRTYLWGVPALGMVALVLKFPNWFSGRTLVALGDMSYSLYLTHVLSLSLAGRIWQTFSRDGWLDNLVMLVVLVAFAILIGQLTYIFIERPLIQYFRRRRSPRDVPSVAH